MEDEDTDKTVLGVNKEQMRAFAEHTPKVLEQLSIEDIKYLMENGAKALVWTTENMDFSMREAAKALWLSNSGSVVVTLGIVVNLNLSGNAIFFLILALISFSYGIYQGVDAQVRPAHNVTKYITEVLRLGMLAYTGKRKIDDIYDDFLKVAPDLTKKSPVITVNLVHAKIALAIGMLLVIVGLGVHYTV